MLRLLICFLEQSDSFSLAVAADFIGPEVCSKSQSTCLTTRPHLCVSSSLFLQSSSTSGTTLSSLPSTTSTTAVDTGFPFFFPFNFTVFCDASFLPRALPLATYMFGLTSFFYAVEDVFLLPLICLLLDVMFSETGDPSDKFFARADVTMIFFQPYSINQVVLQFI